MLGWKNLRSLGEIKSKNSITTQWNDKRSFFN